MSLNTTIPPMGYANILMSQINPRQSFGDLFNSSESNHLHMQESDHSAILKNSLSSLIEKDQYNGLDISVVTYLQNEIGKLQHLVARLQSEKNLLIHENMCLNVKCDTLQTIIINRRGSTSSTESSSSSASLPTDSTSPVEDRKPSLLDSLVEEECNRELNPCNYPLVKSWMRKDWQASMPQSTSARPGSSNKTSRGSGHMAQGINISCTYIQDEQGNTVTAEHTKAIRHWMLSSFRQLEAQDLAPESIGQASLQVLHWLTHMLRKHFIELRFCADNWKAMKLMMDNYLQWYNYHVKKKSNKRVKSELGDDTTIQDIGPPISDNTPTSTTQKRASPEPIDAVNVECATKQPCIDPEVIALVTEPIDEVLPADDNNILPDHQPTPAPCTDKGKTKEVSQVEIKSPLDVLSKPHPKPVPRPTTETSILDTMTNPIPIISDSDSTPLIIVLMHPDASAASLSVKRELINTLACDTALTNKQSGPITKKRQPSMKPMWVSANITARNLCALDWQSNGHQKQLASVFVLYWNNLAAAAKEDYKRKVTAQLSSTSPLVQASRADDASDSDS